MCEIVSKSLFKARPNVMLIWKFDLIWLAITVLTWLALWSWPITANHKNLAKSFMREPITDTHILVCQWGSWTRTLVLFCRRLLPLNWQTLHTFDSHFLPTTCTENSMKLDDHWPYGHTLLEFYPVICMSSTGSVFLATVYMVFTWYELRFNFDPFPRHRDEILRNNTYKQPLFGDRTFVKLFDVLHKLPMKLVKLILIDRYICDFAW